MTEFKIFPVWDSAIYAAEHGDLKPLIKALRSDAAMPQQVRDELAHFLNQIISFKLRRPPGRPRTVGAAARMLMQRKGDGLRLWTANRDVERIKTALNDPEAAKQVAES